MWSDTQSFVFFLNKGVSHMCSRLHFCKQSCFSVFEIFTFLLNNFFWRIFAASDVNHCTNAQHYNQMDEMSVPRPIEQDKSIFEIISVEILGQDPISAGKAGSVAHIQADSVSAAFHAEVLRGKLTDATEVWWNFVATVLPHFSG